MALPDHHQSDRRIARLVNRNCDGRPIEEIEERRVAEQFRPDVTLVAFAMFDRGGNDRNGRQNERIERASRAIEYADQLSAPFQHARILDSRALRPLLDAGPYIGRSEE